jgi:undecaprenyl-diphosphatase
MMADLDIAITRALNAFVGSSPLFDSLVLQLSSNHLIKTVPLVAAIWFLWWREHPQQPRRRATLLAVIAGCFATMALVRLLGNLLPYRARPIQEPSLGVRVIADMPLGFLKDLSSMPSDHAGLFVALAVGLFAVSRPAGAAALLHVALVALVPRVYLGLHYPSDILVGGLLGGTVAWMVTREPVIERIARPALDGFRRRPALAYTALFVVTSQMASMFDSLRGLIGWLRGALEVAGA